MIWGEGGVAPEGAAGPSAGAAALLGIAASPGVVEGPACVVRSVQDLGRLRPGDIVVATATDPTWTSYLSLASGIVLEAGGLLSHGAIIARELGIPAVVDAQGATSEIRSAERLRVDGSAGRVERLA